MDAAIAEPDYACALLCDAHDRLVLQLRPASARHAASQLTCFGGQREPGESATACLGRELGEELGWHPVTIPDYVVRLQDGPRFIASFHVVHLPSDVTLQVEAGSVAIHAPQRSLPGLPLSPWHRQVIDAWLRADREPCVVDLGEI